MPIGKMILPHIPVAGALLDCVPWMWKYDMYDMSSHVGEYHRRHGSSSNFISKFGMPWN